MMEVSLHEIAQDESTQARANGTRVDVVKEYAAAMDDGATFPPVQLYQDGETYYIADGFHRVEAAREAGWETITANVSEGTQRDARLAALAANEAHGIRRTNEDRRNAVRQALADPEWSRWPDREIARACNVSHPLVKKIRDELTEAPSRPTGNATSTGNVTKATNREARLLSSVSDRALVDECKRRGLGVE